MKDQLAEYTKNMQELKNLPKANVVRISVLSPTERQRYLGTIDSVIDGVVKTPIYQRIYADDPVFYGIMNADESVGFTINPQWSQGNTAGTIGGVVRDLAASTKLGKRAGAAGDIMRAMTGISGSTTGSSTMSTFGGVKLNAFKIGCTWYLPEQYSFCMHSMRNIMRMAYPVQVPDDMFAKAIGDAVGSIGNAIAGAEVKEQERKQAEATANGEDPSDVALDSESSSVIGNALGGAGNMILDGIQFANDLLGRNLALDPIPVRCAIGHYLDIEPLVITGVDTKFSAETFLHDSGRHLPVTCSIEISFDFWMVPAPKIAFMNVGGVEMFNEGMSYQQQREYEEALAASLKEKADAHEYAKDSNHRFGSKTAYENNPNKFGDMDDSIANLRPLKK